MKHIVIDGKDIQSKVDFHDLIARRFEFPSYYGKNLDALWECLSDDRPNQANLIWKNHESSKAAMGADFDEIIDTLKEFETEDPTFHLELT